MVSLGKWSTFMVVIPFCQGTPTVTFQGSTCSTVSCAWQKNGGDTHGKIHPDDIHVHWCLNGKKNPMLMLNGKKNGMGAWNTQSWGSGFKITLFDYINLISMKAIQTHVTAVPEIGQCSSRDCGFSAPQGSASAMKFSWSRTPWVQWLWSSALLASFASVVDMSLGFLGITRYDFILLGHRTISYNQFICFSSF